MNGIKGLGKNILSDIIFKALLGRNNHKVAHQEALSKGFNAILKECRMIVFDEFKIVEDAHINTLKRYANTDQMIEHKGIDVGNTEKTFNSFIICNNAITDMRVEWDDRRFSVVDLSTTKLEDAWSTERIDYLISIFQNETEVPLEVRQFGYWLLYRDPVVAKSPFYCYKGEHFYRLCYASFPEWAKMIIDEVTDGVHQDYFEEADLKRLFKDRTNGVQRFPNAVKVEDFIKNYKHKGKDYLGHIEKDDRTYYLQVNPIFVKNKSVADNTGIKFLSISEADLSLV
jgi:hypothetical protein